MSTNSPPLCVDLDGTLIHTDLLLESAVQLLTEKPWFVFVIPLWLLQGKAKLKRNIAKRVQVNASVLPYNADVLQWLRDEKVNGRTLVLATASDQVLAKEVSDHLGIFDWLLASDGASNVKGDTKLEQIRARFGQVFDYAGNSMADLPIWKGSRGAILVNASTATAKAAEEQAHVVRVFKDQHSTIKLIVRELRVYQWMKNLLVFLPLLTSHQIGHLDLLRNACIAFVSFSLTASSVYIVNDVADLESDRRHARKRKRPFASGNLSLTYAFVLGPGLLLAGFALTALLPTAFFWVLTLYFCLTLLYSFWLKRKLLVDVFSLATLYTLRIIAGQAAYGVELSSWLLSFSMFIFLSLGFSKRASELDNAQRSSASENTRRGYRISDLPQVNIFGIASGFSASLVLTLYMNSENVRNLYRHPDVLWLLFPLLLYWISRIWMLTWRGEMNEDPILFAAKDRITRLVILMTAGLMFLATRDWYRF